MLGNLQGRLARAVAMDGRSSKRNAASINGVYAMTPIGFGSTFAYEKVPLQICNNMCESASRYHAFDLLMLAGCRCNACTGDRERVCYESGVGAVCTCEAKLDGKLSF